MMKIINLKVENSENIIHDTCFIVKNRFSTQVSKISFLIRFYYVRFESNEVLILLSENDVNVLLFMMWIINITQWS